MPPFCRAMPLNVFLNPLQPCNRPLYKLIITRKLPILPESLIFILFCGMMYPEAERRTADAKRRRLASPTGHYG